MIKQLYIVYVIFLTMLNTWLECFAHLVHTYHDDMAILYKYLLAVKRYYIEKNIFSRSSPRGSYTPIKPSCSSHGRSL